MSDFKPFSYFFDHQQIEIKDRNEILFLLLIISQIVNFKIAVDSFFFPIFF
jgi:hypothetical protein